MIAIKIIIVRFIDDHQPGFVECTFKDAWNVEHIIREKIPIVTDKKLDINSTYPLEGIIACKHIKKWVDDKGRTLFTVNTDKPWGVQTVDGKTEFDLCLEQLIKLNF